VSLAKPTRRQFIAGTLATALGSRSFAQGPNGSGERAAAPHRIVDVHAHMVPRFVAEAATAAGYELVDPRGWPNWSPADALAVIDRLGIGTSILSAPFGVYGQSASAGISLAQQVNDLAAELKADRPDRFGFFASLPLPNVDAALVEATRALDDLQADGVVLLSNSQGKYPGDSAFDPLFAELDRRAAVIFIHPEGPTCPACAGPEFAMGTPVLEYMFETTRAVANLIASRALDRFPNLKFVIAHGGAAIPALADRIAIAGPTLTVGARFTTQDVYRDFGRLYFDLAGTPLPRQLPALRTIANTERLLYGSDWPFTPEVGIRALQGQMLAASAAEPPFWEGALATNALALFPRLARYE
jgi:predicted TIM-barrel fold metal-dependent hydrolase